MKKLIYGSLFLALVGIGVVGCKKNEVTENRPLTSSESSTNLAISTVELNSILEEINSIQKVGPGWWKKFTSWVNSHSGSAQRWVNGQPTCVGDGGCGPCAGICFSSGLMQGNSTGSLTADQLASGLRAFQMSLIEKTNSATEKKIFLEIPSAYVSSFVMDNIISVRNDQLLPYWFVTGAGLSEIKIISGVYPVSVMPNGSVEVLFNITTK
jgi:hypothetical protein